MTTKELKEILLVLRLYEKPMTKRKKLLTLASEVQDDSELKRLLTNCATACKGAPTRSEMLRFYITMNACDNKLDQWLIKRDGAVNRLDEYLNKLLAESEKPKPS